MNYLDKKNSLRQIIERHLGKANAISRAILSDALQIHDRDVRHLIHDLRAEGHLIGSTSKNAGYYLCETLEEKMETLHDLKSRAFSALHLVSKLDRNPLYIHAARVMQLELGL